MQNTPPFFTKIPAKKNKAGVSPDTPAYNNIIYIILYAPD